MTRYRPADYRSSQAWVLGEQARSVGATVLLDLDAPDAEAATRAAKRQFRPDPSVRSEAGVA